MMEWVYCTTEPGFCTDELLAFLKTEGPTIQSENLTEKLQNLKSKFLLNLG